MDAMDRKFERAAAPVASSSSRSNEAFTSADVTATPSLNLASGSSLNVSVNPSAENSQLSATAGTTSSSALWRTSGS
jgi:hypothetical protein